MSSRDSLGTAQSSAERENRAKCMCEEQEMARVENLRLKERVKKLNMIQNNLLKQAHPPVTPDPRV